MSKPRIEVKDKVYYRDIHFLYEIVFSLKDIEEMKLFLKDILTKSELRMIKRRWHIANMVYDGLDIRTIAARAESSTQTVSRIKKTMEEGNGGLRIGIERVNTKQSEERKKHLRSKKPRRGSKFVKGWFDS